MSILQPEIPGARVVDLFAGSGALGLEALSRGAAHCDFVEIATRSLAALRANAEKLGAGDTAARGSRGCAEVRRSDWSHVHTTLPSPIHHMG